MGGTNEKGLSVVPRWYANSIICAAKYVHGISVGMARRIAKTDLSCGWHVWHFRFDGGELDLGRLQRIPPAEGGRGTRPGRGQAAASAAICAAVSAPL